MVIKPWPSILYKILCLSQMEPLGRRWRQQAVMSQTFFTLFPPLPMQLTDAGTDALPTQLRARTRTHPLMHDALHCGASRRLGVSLFVVGYLGITLVACGQEQIMRMPAPVQAIQKSPLTLADCIRIGLEQQPTLAAQRASLAGAQSAYAGLDNMRLASALSHEMAFRKQQASLGINIAQAGLETAEWETIYAISRCYFTVVYARKQEAVAKGLIDKLEQAHRNAQALVKKGDPDSVVTQVDVDKLAVNIDLLQMRLIEASTGIERATAALRESMGIGCDVPLPLVLEEFPPAGGTLDRERVIALALARRGEIVQASGIAQVAELEVCAQNTGCLLPFKFTFAAGSDIHSRAIPEGANNGTYRPAAVGPEMPVLMVGRKGDRVARAQDYSSRADAVLEKTRNLIALETDDAYRKWQAAAAQVKTMRDSAPKSAKLTELISSRFDNGKVSGEDYLRARTLEEQSQSQLNEALFQHALALAALERVTAGGFTPNYRRASAAR
jgi:outer membrane protein TolC